jgi:hypothetical protein
MYTIAKGTLIAVMSELETVPVILTCFLTCLVRVYLDYTVKAGVIPVVKSIREDVFHECVEKFGEY